MYQWDTNELLDGLQVAAVIENMAFCLHKQCRCTPMRVACSMFYDSSFSALMRQVPKANTYVSSYLNSEVGSKKSFHDYIYDSNKAAQNQIPDLWSGSGTLYRLKQSHTCIKLCSISDNLSYVCHKHNLMHH